jgi:hypothetical protein
MNEWKRRALLSLCCAGLFLIGAIADRFMPFGLVMFMGFGLMAIWLGEAALIGFRGRGRQSLHTMEEGSDG